MRDYKVREFWPGDRVIEEATLTTLGNAGWQVDQMELTVVGGAPKTKYLFRKEMLTPKEVKIITFRTHGEGENDSTESDTLNEWLSLGWNLRETIVVPFHGMPNNFSVKYVLERNTPEKGVNNEGE